MTRNQQCDIFLAIYTRYLIGLAIAAWLAVSGYPIAGLAFALAWIGLRLIYARWLFRFVAPLIGYGSSLADTTPAQATAAPTQSPTTVTLYTATGCPFCPILEARLKTLQQQMGFALQREDVTLKPQALTSKGLRSVPVTEVGDRRLVGNATSAQLAAFIQNRAAA